MTRRFCTLVLAANGRGPTRLMTSRCEGAKVNPITAE
jgi:hypothetical protein